MPTENHYDIQLSFSKETVLALINGGYSLYQMFAVCLSDDAARPTIWSRRQSFMKAMTLSWSDAVSAYTASVPVANGQQILAGFEIAIDNAQVLTVGVGGLGTVSAGGPADKISITNKTTTGYTTGLARAMGGVTTPFFAAPLYGNQTLVVGVLPQTLLQISTKAYALGDVVDSFFPMTDGAVFTSSVLITGDSTSPRKVTFDINKGWSWGGGSWAQNIPANANLSTVLIKTET